MNADLDKRSKGYFKRGRILWHTTLQFQRIFQKGKDTDETQRRFPKSILKEERHLRYTTLHFKRPFKLQEHLFYTALRFQGYFSKEGQGWYRTSISVQEDLSHTYSTRGSRNVRIEVQKRLTLSLPSLVSSPHSLLFLPFFNP